MEAKQLRIGNYIYYNNNILIIDSICKNLASAWDLEYKGNWNYNIEDIKPIPLTEEWLLKAGFKLFGKDATDSISPEDWYWIKNGFRFHIDNVSWFNSTLNVKIRYVHQLQNLFHSLTSEELTFKQL